jgi:hypothetical protein
MIGFIDTLYTPHGTTYMQLQRYRYSHSLQITVTRTSFLSLLHCPLVISWQRIYNSLTVISNHILSLLLRSIIPFLSVFLIAFDCRYSQYTAATAKSGTRLNSNSSQSQSHFTTGGLPPISSSWRRAPWESQPEFFSLNWTPALIVLV